MIRLTRQIEFSAKRFPWQKVDGVDAVFYPGKDSYGWHAFGSSGRFGGGWRFKFGFECGDHSITLNLGIGIVTFYHHIGWPWKAR